MCAQGKRRRILVFGNPLVKEDSLPLELLPNLRRTFPEIEFVEFDAAEDLENEGEGLVIIDTVKGVRKTVLITDVDSIGQSSIYSMHDFDLGITLKLLKKMGLVKSVRIFGVPVGYDKETALKELEGLLRANLS